MKLEDYRDFVCHTEEDHKEFDNLIVNYIIEKQLEDLLYKEQYGNMFLKLEIKKD